MNAQQLKNAILQEAIEGRLVPQDPNDEPASVLLARIRKEKERLVKEGKLKKKDLEIKPISEDEIPFEIPKSWEWVRLKTISRSITDGDHMPPPKADSGIPFLVISNVIKGYIDFSNTRFVPKSYYDNITADRKAENGDVLFTVTGSYGKAVLINTDRTFCFQRHIALVKPLTFSAFIEMMLNSPYVKTECDDKATGMAQKTVGIDTLRSFIVPLPPLAEQHRIVAKIEELLPKVEEYGKAKDALNKLNAELPERLKKSILQEAIEGRLVPQDPNDEPASVLLDKIRQEKAQLVKAGKLKKKDLIETSITEDEIPFEIPDSWEWAKLGDVTEIARGGSPRPIKEYLTNAPNGLNWIKIGDTDKGGKYINSCKEKIKPEGLKKTRMVHPGDFLLTNSMSFGRPYITNIEGCIHDGWLMISPYAGVFDQSFLFYVLSSAFAHKQFNDKVAGAVVQNLNSDKVADSIIPLPPLAEQHRIVKKLEQLLGKIELMNK